MKLTRDRSTGGYYTEDKEFKIKRCSVRAYGWVISKRREDGTYRLVTYAASLPHARKLVSGKEKKAT